MKNLFFIVPFLFYSILDHSQLYYDEARASLDNYEHEMVFVEGGTFLMGCTAENDNDCSFVSKPVHQVTLNSFYIGKYEVTQAQWKAITGKNPSHFKGDSLPVDQVTWVEMNEFIDKLNAVTGKQYRLPTEAEWEFAARGGNKSNGYMFSGSNTIHEVAWFRNNSRKTTHPVGTKQPNELGIHDMSGNVKEFCSDYIDYYSSDSQTNPTGPSSGIGRAARGGYWETREKDMYVWERTFEGSNISNHFLGFRLAHNASGVVP